MSTSTLTNMIADIKRSRAPNHNVRHGHLLSHEPLRPHGRLVDAHVTYSSAFVGAVSCARHVTVGFVCLVRSGVRCAERP